MDLDHKHILRIFNAHPKGLGFNELAKLVDISPVTLRKKLDHLLELGFVRQEPEGVVKRGKKILYFSSDGYKKYNDFLDRIVEETDRVIEKLDNIDLDNKYAARFLDHVLVKIFRQFSMSVLYSSLCSWNSDWVNNDEIASEFLMLNFSSLKKIAEKINILLQNKNIKEGIENLRLLRLKKMEEFYEKNASLQYLEDTMDTNIFNLYKNPNDILNIYLRAQQVTLVRKDHTYHL